MNRMINKLRTPLGQTLLCLIWVIVTGGIIIIALDTFILFPIKASAETIDTAVAAHQPVIVLSLIHTGYSLLMFAARLPWWIWVPAVATPVVAVLTQASEAAPNPNALVAYLLGSSVVIVSMLLTLVAVLIKQNKQRAKQAKD